MADEPLTGAARPAASDADRPAKKKAERRGVFAALGLFLRQIIDELRKVVRPTRREWLTYTAVVIVFVVTVMLFVFGLDTVFTKFVFWVFAGTAS